MSLSGVELSGTSFFSLLFFSLSLGRTAGGKYFKKVSIVNLLETKSAPTFVG